MMSNLQITFSGGLCPRCFLAYSLWIEHKSCLVTFPQPLWDQGPVRRKAKLNPPPFRTIIESWESVKSLGVKHDTTVVSIVRCGEQRRNTRNCGERIEETERFNCALAQFFSLFVSHLGAYVVLNAPKCQPQKASL